MATRRPLGPIALSACLQVDATCHNAVIQEQSMGIHYNDTNSVLNYILNKEVFDFKDGYVELPQGPGLGLEVNREFIVSENGDHKWRNPVWRHANGSIAEW